MTKQYLLLGLATLLLAGCASAGPAQEVRLETNAMTFNTNQIEVKAGRPVKLDLVNTDSVLHDFAIQKIDVKVKAAGHDDHAHADTTDLHVSASAGKTGTVEFTPEAAGTYTYYCTVAGHRDAGMEGQLVVKAS
ncbi:MAG TPA: cupredoxin domain-containing protein [Symbiobacteriaceae bacterium]|nr:cupredoxin domain-containing protein [Symbiobacteriaceae bacterium]